MIGATVFSKKFAGAVSRQLHFNKSKLGEYTIPVSNLYDKDLEGIENVIVFVKGSIECPEITRIAKIEAKDYNDIDEIRRILYESEGRGFQREASELLRFHYNPTSESSRYVTFGESSDGGTNSSGKRVGRRSGKTDKGAVGFREFEKGITEYQYFDRTTEKTGCFSHDLQGNEDA